MFKHAAFARLWATMSIKQSNIVWNHCQPSNDNYLIVIAFAVFTILPETTSHHIRTSSGEE